MALLFMDSFDHYATADIAEKWTQLVVQYSGTPVASVIGAYGRNSTQGFRASVTGVTTVSVPVGITSAPSGAVCLIGMAVKYNDFATLAIGTRPFVGSWGDGSSQSSNWIAAICDTNSYQVWFRVNVNGTITALCGNANGSAVLGTTSLSLQAGVWAYVEIKVLIDPSAGTVDIRINGVSGLSLTGQNTRVTANSQWNEVRLGYMTPTSAVTYTVDFDDVVVMDGSGSVNKDFLGDVTVQARYPTADGATHDGIPSVGDPDTGVNYACVDEALASATDYVSLTDAGDLDTYTTENVETGSVIKAVQVVAMASKTDDGAAAITATVYHDAANHDHPTPQGVSTTAAFHRFIFETDPDADAWTDTSFNAAEFGAKKST